MTTASATTPEALPVIAGPSFSTYVGGLAAEWPDLVTAALADLPDVHHRHTPGLATVHEWNWRAEDEEGGGWIVIAKLDYRGVVRFTVTADIWDAAPIDEEPTIRMEAPTPAEVANEFRRLCGWVREFYPHGHPRRSV